MILADKILGDRRLCYLVVAVEAKVVKRLEDVGERDGSVGYLTFVELSAGIFLRLPLQSAVHSRNLFKQVHLQIYHFVGADAGGVGGNLLREVASTACIVGMMAFGRAQALRRSFHVYP